MFLINNISPNLINYDVNKFIKSLFRTLSDYRRSGSIVITKTKQPNVRIQVDRIENQK